MFWVVILTHSTWVMIANIYSIAQKSIYLYMLWLCIWFLSCGVYASLVWTCLSVPILLVCFPRYMHVYIGICLCRHVHMSMCIYIYICFRVPRSHPPTMELSPTGPHLSPPKPYLQHFRTTTSQRDPSYVSYSKLIHLCNTYQTTDLLPVLYLCTTQWDLDTTYVMYWLALSLYDKLHITRLYDTPWHSLQHTN